MKVLKNILGRVFATWGIIVFLLSMLLFYIPILVTGLWKEPRRTTLFIRVSRVWMKVFFTLVGVRRIFKGRENLEKGRNYVVVCNHNTYMDVPLSSPGIPGVGNKTIAKAEMARIPLFGLIYKRGSVLVDRKSEESRKASYLQMKEVLQMGLHMCIYPEGTRNKTALPLQKFHDGAFRLAVDSGHAVLPALIFYSKKVFPPDKKFYLWPHRMEMHFLPPVYPGTLSTTELKDKVFVIMHDYYTRYGH